MERIRQLREYLGLSQNSFARVIGKTGAFIAEVENGRRQFSDETISRVCQCFGVRDEWIRSGEGEMLLPGMERAGVDKSGIGGRIRTARKKAGIKQKELATRIGAGVNYFCQVELGNNIPSDGYLRRIADALSVSFTWLKTGSEDQISPEEQIRIITQRIVEDEELREKVYQIVNSSAIDL